MNIKKNKESVTRFLGRNNLICWAILVGITIIFCIILYPGLVVTNRSYGLGDVADRDIKAPRDFFVEDVDATATKRQQAAEEVLTVYDYDSMLSTRLFLRVRRAFADLRAVIESERQSRKDKKRAADSNSNGDEAASVHDRIWEMKKYFEDQIDIKVSNGAYEILEKENFSKEIANIIIVILEKILNNGTVANKEILLREEGRGIIFKNVETKTEKIVYNLKRFYGLDQAKTMVRIVSDPFLKEIDYSLRNLIVDFSQLLIQPNITINRSETEQRRKNAAAGVKPILYKVKAGEMLLREGERVTNAQLIKLKALQDLVAHKQIMASSIGAAMLIIFLLTTIYLLSSNNNGQISHSHNKNVLFVASVLVTFFIIAKISGILSETLIQHTIFKISVSSVFFAIPLSAGTMTVCIFMGMNVAFAFTVVIATCIALIFQNRFEFFIYFLISGLMAGYWVQNCRERKVFIKAGVKLGLLNILLASAINVYTMNFFDFKLLWDWIFAFSGGIGAGIVTAGIVPLIEITFGYTTDISLLELANLDKPILRRLMLEAPGTYHHSVLVGTLVEAAASEIGANPLLAKVCGYYHDIGKIKKPLYFVENQVNGKNIHDKLAPSMSSLILTAHIKTGVEIAKENRLGRTIIDTIIQHHGTSLITYFYEKAKQIRGEGSVDISDFRYPGPIPQTREAGLVMLADVVEAASRTLENPTPSRIQGLVQELINKIFSDGQLDNCELTLKDLHKIAKSFNKILNGIHHHRIEYPEKLTLVNGKAKDGNSGKQQSKQMQDGFGSNKAKGTGHLKRLGLS